MLIAGNWKMFKGPPRRGPLPTRSTRPTGVDVVVCPPYLSLAAAVEGGLDRVRARTSTGRPRARSPARSPRRCFSSSASRARSSATRSGASSSARRTRRSRAAPIAALEAGLGVIACVGESEEEREAGQTEDHHPAAGRVDPRRRRGARAARHRVRAGVGDRNRQDRHARAGARGARLHQGRSSTSPCSTAAPSSRRTRTSSSPSPMSTAPSSAAPRSKSSPSPRFASRQPVSARSARHPRRLGLRAAGAGERRRAGGHARLRRPLGAATRTRRSKPRAKQSASRTGRWGTPRSAT